MGDLRPGSRTLVESRTGTPQSPSQEQTCRCQGSSRETSTPPASTDVLAVIPAWNECGRLPGVIADLRSHGVADILVVDDGSDDGTPDEARRLGCTVISHERNGGAGAAIRTGIEYALAGRYDVIVVVNATGKTPARCIPGLVRPITTEGYDFVQGSRYIAGGRAANLPLHRSIGTRLHSALFSLCLGRKVTDGTSGFRAFRVSILRDPGFRLGQSWLDGYELEPYLYYRSVELGYRVKEAPVDIIYPESGRFTKMRVIVDWWRITRPLIYLRLGFRK